MSNLTKIKFGTDGWRAIIDEGFTVDNVKCVAQAIADYVKKGKVIVGFDTRNHSPEFAERLALVLASNGLSVILSHESVPTPVLSYKVKETKAQAGVMITASHNPAQYNGLKIKGNFGGPVDKRVTSRIEALLGQSPVKEKKEAGIKVVREDFSLSYLTGVRGYIKEEFLKNRRFKIVVDNMYGAGGDYLPQALSRSPIEVMMMRNARDISFGGISPEPIAENLEALVEKVRENKADIGLATDGDADRLGVVDAQGSYINAQLVFAVLLLNLLESRPWRGGVVKSVACTFLLDKIAKKFALPVYETSIGFKYAAQHMVERDILIGGEESGGYGFKGRPPERDGILSGLLILELMARRKQSLAEILKDMEKEFGPYFYKRIDIKCPPVKKEKYQKKLEVSLSGKIGNKKVKNVNKKDGYKFILEDDSWLLLRFSGTEAKLRIYAEAGSPEELEVLLFEGKKMIGGEQLLGEVKR